MTANNKAIINIGKMLDEQDVTLDVNELIYSKGLILASSGFGKSMLLRMLIERIAPIVQTVVIDPDGEFPSLREKLDILIVGGDNADVKLDIQSAALLARKLAETRVSAGINLYEIPGTGDPWDKRRQWFANFMNGYMNLPKSLWNYVFMPIDEAHQFAPEGMVEDSARSSRSAMRLGSSQGRKHGLGILQATQRISKIDKDATSDARNIWIGGANLDIDVERAAKMLGLKSKDYNIIREMNPGEFFSYGPTFMKRGVLRFAADKALTTHPKAGKILDVKVPKASSKMHEIADLFGDLPQEAHTEAVTLESLTREKLRLEREVIDLTRKQKEQVTAAAPVIVPEPEIIEIKIPIFNEANIVQLQTVLEEMNSLSASLAPHIKYVTDAVDKADKIDTENSARVNEIKRMTAAASRTLPIFPGLDKAVTATRTKATPIVLSTKGIDQGVAPSKLPQGPQTILSYCAMHPEGLRRDQLTVLSGYKKDTRNQYIRELLTWGFVQDNGVIVITQLGILALGSESITMPEGERLRHNWITDLPKGESEILAILMNSYPNPVSRNELTELTGYKKDTRNQYIRNLIKFFLIEDLPSSMVKASDYLFT